MRFTLLLAAAAATLAFASASAQPYGGPQSNNPYNSSYNSQRDNSGQRDPSSYYSQTDQAGYYDRNGTYRRVRDRSDSGAYYQQGAYEQNCSRGNVATGTIFGALAGGLIGNAASHGNGGAVVGGAVLGGLLGNAVSKDISCDDQPYAFKVYSAGLNGDVGRRYDWNHNQARGYFTPTREYRRAGVVCRDFTETSYRGNQQLTHSGTACRAQDGNWRFD
jgi:surface antigen